MCNFISMGPGAHCLDQPIETQKAKANLRCVSRSLRIDKRVE